MMIVIVIIIKRELLNIYLFSVVRYYSLMFNQLNRAVGEPFLETTRRPIYKLIHFIRS